MGNKKHILTESLLPPVGTRSDGGVGSPETPLLGAADGMADQQLTTPGMSAGLTVDPAERAQGGAGPTTSFPAAVFLLTNAILGGGILGQAYAARQSGQVYSNSC